MFWRNLKQYSSWSILILVTVLSYPVFAYASNGFLTLPFKHNSEFKLMQGWNYNFSNLVHQGIDYYASVGTELYAPYDGLARSYKQAGRSRSYGNYVVIDHENGYKTLYAHMSEVNIPSDRFVRVSYGDIIGKAGISGTDNPHLHFEVLSDSYNKQGFNRGHGWRVDPYDLYTVKSYYPEGNNYTSSGPGILWKTDPPSFLIDPPQAVSLGIYDSSYDYVHLKWTKNTSEKFHSYKLYRSSSSPVDNETPVEVFEKEDSFEFKDKSVNSKSSYYYVLYVCNTVDLCTASNEVSLKTKRDPSDLGEIIYTSKVDGYSQIFLMSGAQDNVTQLTDLIGNVSDPKWSPDGERILFSAHEPKDYTRQVFVMNKDGSNIRQVTNAKYSAHQADWFPDGKRIVYHGFWESGVGRGIYTKTLDQNDDKLITPITINPYDPAVSNDGGMIIYSASYRSGGAQKGLFTTILESGETVQISYNNDFDPEMSPIESLIVYRSSKYTNNNKFHDLFIAPIEEANYGINLTKGGRGSVKDPAFSPDGKVLVYSFREDVDKDFEIFYRYSETGSITQLTLNDVDDGSPDIWFEI